MATELGYQNVYRYATGYPEWKDKQLPTDSVTVKPITAPVSESPGPLSGFAMIWTLMGIFLGGIALNLTPCVYPLIPITVSYFGGRSGKGKGKLLGHGICYIGGLSLTNSLLGVAAALSGSLLGSFLQNPLILTGVAIVLLVFATSLFGFWEFKLPSGLTQAASKSYTGYFGSLFMGLTMGVIAAPCIGPFVLGLLTWVASMGNPWLGFIIFFILSLGLGLPLLILALFSGKIDKLPKSGDWMLWVRTLLGWVLIGMAAYFIRPVLPKPLGLLLLASVPLMLAIHLGWIYKVKSESRTFLWIRSIVGLVGVLAATIMIGSWLIQGPGVQWYTYSQELMAEARTKNKPVIIDFTAEWCTPCREFDEITFHHPDIVKMSEGKIIMIKVDLTKKGNAISEELVSRYAVKGVPTILFFNRQGEELKHLRLIDFLPPDKFLNQMAEILKMSE